MGLRDFINDTKEKRVNKLTDEQKLSWLNNKKLDEYTLNLIVKDLELDLDKSPFEGCIFVPSEKNKFSDEQNRARLAAHRFIVGDTIYDNKNYMYYTYCEHRANNTFGFDGMLDKNLVKKLGVKNIDVTIPNQILDSKVHSIEQAFMDTQHLNINLTINASRINVTHAFWNSGITHIPDFRKIDAHYIDVEYGNPDIDNDWYYESYRINKDMIASMVCQKNVPLQERLDFVINNYNAYKSTKYLDIPEREKETIYRMEQASHDIAKNYFCLDTEKSFLTTADINEVQKFIILSESDKCAKVEFLAQLATDQITVNNGFQEMVVNQLMQSFKLTSLKMDSVLPMYLEDIDTDKISISVANIGKKGAETVYLVTTDDNIGFIYNASKNTFDYSGKVTDISTVSLNDAYLGCNFEQVPRGQYDAILNDIKFKNSELAQDVLESDNISVPETNIEEKEQEI